MTALATPVRTLARLVFYRTSQGHLCGPLPLFTKKKKIERGKHKQRPRQ